MSEITVDDVKRYLRIVTANDDDLLQDLIDNAEDEALQYLDMTALPVYESDAVESSIASDRHTIGRSFRAAVCVLVQAQYEETDASKIAEYRKRAESLLFPYRVNLGA